MATLKLNADALSELRRKHLIEFDYQLAQRIGVDAATVSRVLAGTDGPGPKFIAGCAKAFGMEAIATLFIATDEAVA